MPHHQQALAIAREIGDRYNESLNLTYLARGEISQVAYAEAIQLSHQAAQIADEMQNRETQSEAYRELTLAQLLSGDLTAAFAAVTSARQHDYPLNNANVLALQGIIQLRLNQTTAAQAAFTAAIAHANGLLAQTPQLYDALDTVGLAQAGLALCGARNPVFVKNRVSEHVTTAIESYSAARAITSAPGIVRRVLRLFDALAVIDTEGVLTDVRAAAAGEEAV